MYSLYDCVRLWVSGGSNLSLNNISIFYLSISKSWPSNSPPRSYVISTVHVYRISHIVSTKFVIIIAIFSLYCVPSNHLVMVSIIVTYFNIRSPFAFINIILGHMRSIHMLFCGVSSSNLAGNLPFFKWLFCTLTRVIFRDLLLGGFYNACPVQMLANHWFRSIQYRILYTRGTISLRIFGIFVEVLFYHCKLQDS